MGSVLYSNFFSNGKVTRKAPRLRIPFLKTYLKATRRAPWLQVTFRKKTGCYKSLFSTPWRRRRRSVSGLCSRKRVKEKQYCRRSPARQVQRHQQPCAQTYTSFIPTLDFALSSKLATTTTAAAVNPPSFNHAKTQSHLLSSKPNTVLFLKSKKIVAKL